MIIVFGSVSSDMVFKVSRLPQAGETIIGTDYDITSGGKGANQAFAAARMGAKVALVGCAGNDGASVRLLNKLKREGVRTAGVSESPDKLTGCAIIIRDKDGRKQAVMAQGANMDAKADQVPDEILLPSNIVLMQMEVDPVENQALIDRAHERGTKTIMNLAPAVHLPEATFKKLDYLIVNEIEARQIAKPLNIDIEKNALQLAHALSRMGELTCIITLGEGGSRAVTKDGKEYSVPALKLDAFIDITGAGDAYCGTFAAALQNGMSVYKAMKYASVAATLSCKSRGAQDSFPYISEIEENLPLLDDQTKVN